MKYIPLEEVQELIKSKLKEFYELRKNPGLLPKDSYINMIIGVEEVSEEIMDIQTIDPIQIIDDMIEEIDTYWTTPDRKHYMRKSIEIGLLEKLKQKLLLNSK